MSNLPHPIAQLIPPDVKDFKLEPMNLLQYPPHPGKVLRLVLQINNITEKDFSTRILVKESLIGRFCSEQLSVTAELSLRLGKAFNMDYEYWLNLQRTHDVYSARATMQSELNKIDSLRVGR